MDALVTTGWLAETLGANDLRVLDASWFLPDHGRDPAAEYVAGHIPGALFLDLDSLADGANSLPSMLPDADAFAARLSALGVGDGDRIVVYDDSPLHSAARAWWALRTMGARDVAILDGGLAKWRAEGRPLESGAAPAPVAAAFAATRGDVVDIAEMKRVIDGGGQVVDARSPARFAGSEPEPRPGVVPGHMPGAINLPYARLFAADGTWKRDDALRAAFTDAGVAVDSPVVTTCGSGVTAAVLVFGLHLLGRDARLYDGSWAEWGGDPTTAKVTGA